MMKKKHSWSWMRICLGIVLGACLMTFLIQRPMTAQAVSKNDIQASLNGTGGNQKLYVAIRKDGEIPGEPSLLQDTEYKFFVEDRLSSTYYSKYTKGFIDSNIVNYDNFRYTSVDGSNTAGMVDGTGATTSMVIKNINFDDFLTAIAKDGSIYATNGKKVTTNNKDDYKVICY